MRRTCENLSGTTGIPIVPGETLLFIDEIQTSKEAIMSLRYFKEDYPELQQEQSGGGGLCHCAPWHSDACRDKGQQAGEYAEPMGLYAPAQSS